MTILDLIRAVVVRVRATRRLARELRAAVEDAVDVVAPALADTEEPSFDSEPIAEVNFEIDGTPCKLCGVPKYMHPGPPPGKYGRQCSRFRPPWSVVTEREQQVWLGTDRLGRL